MSATTFQLHPEDGPPTVEPVNDVEVLPAPTDPLAVVRALLTERVEDGQLLLRRWRGDWWTYQGPHWVIYDPEALRKWLYLRTEGAVYLAKKKGSEDEFEEKPWAPNQTKINHLIDALGAPTLLDTAINAPSWLDTGLPATGTIACANGLLDLATDELRPMTPRYFGTVGVPFDYDPAADAPLEWLKFLHSVWPNSDGGEIRTLQQWFGYVLSGRLDLQKLLLLIGPPRSGKGTIARVLTALLGPANCTAPTLAGMAKNFGLETSIGKSLMVIGDARLQAQGQETVVERLLSITGQDGITLDRKNRQAWTGTMQARVMILSNELPKFLDASTAIASRFVILRCTESFLGREDIGLGRRLEAELPQILKWAVAGLRDVAENGRLSEPTSMASVMQELHDVVSPISTFLRDVCVLGVGVQTPFSKLFHEYAEWCRENNRGQKSAAAFSADLHALVPDLRTDHRPRDAQGRRMPRHVVGLSINPEWTARVRESPYTQWRPEVHVMN